MPAALVLAGPIRRRAIVRVAVTVATTSILMGVMAFVGVIAVVAAGSGGARSACFVIVPSGESTPGRGAGMLEIHNSDGQLFELTTSQIGVARSYISMGKQMAVPKAGQIIAIMMALQESSLRVLANSNVPDSLQLPHDGIGSDHDSLGTAQQRPAAGWGSVEQLMDPGYDARAFYGGPAGPNHGTPQGLLDIRGWPLMEKGHAAQAVQVSAFPELYARWEAEATAIVDSLESDTAQGNCVDSSATPLPVTGTANLSQLRRDILKFAEQGVGGTYTWGGAEFKAWDCSGYVQWIYRQVGMDLPRVEQWRVGKQTDSPQPGDLVVQNPQGPENWGHVGIYAGDGMMYSALNPAVGTLLHPVSWNSGTAYFSLLNGL